MALGGKLGHSRRTAHGGVHGGGPSACLDGRACEMNIKEEEEEEIQQFLRASKMEKVLFTGPGRC